MRTTQQLLAEILALAGGAIRDATGKVTTLAPAGTPVVATPDDAHVASAREALAAARHVIVPIELGGGGIGRMPTLLLARRRIRNARRWLGSAGATRVRTFAAVPGEEALFVVYEIGGNAQRYVEDRVVLEPAQSRQFRMAKAALAWLTGLATAAELVIVVGDAR